MCKYCNLKETGISGEKTNDVMSIAKVKDGSHVLILNMNRYLDEESGVKSNELIIDMAILIRDEEYTVKEKHIDISYCPFCGEKL